jgi:hypothetical protein
VTESRRVDKRYAADRCRADYAHVGLYDVSDGRVWIARKRLGSTPIRMSHAQLLVGGSHDTSVADKDRFVCYWYHTPNTGDGPVHGFPIDWSEGHLMIRLDPNWDYQAMKLVPSTDERRLEANIDRQYRWGKRVFDLYVAQRPRFAISWHLIGPRPVDSMFYVERAEAKG